MKSIFFLIIVSLVSVYHVLGQSLVPCSNEIQVVIMPIQVKGISDSLLIPKIKQDLQNTLIAKQQEYRYRIVKDPEKADVALHVRYVIKNNGYPDQVTAIHFRMISRIAENLEKSVKTYYSYKDREKKEGNSALSHQGSDFLERMQEEKVLFTIFSDIKPVSSEYVLEAPLLVVHDFIDQDSAVSIKTNCMQAIYYSNLKQAGHAFKRRVNIYTESEMMKRKLGMDTNTVHLYGKLSENYGRGMLSLYAMRNGEIIYTNEVELDKALVDEESYRPFIYDQLYDIRFLNIMTR